MKISVGPLQYLWEREAALRFYAELCDAPVDIVYLGEVVCSKRRLLMRGDWPNVAQALRDSGKQVVFSTLALLEAESELATLARIIDQSECIEANDYAAVETLSRDATSSPARISTCTTKRRWRCSPGEARVAGSRQSNCRSRRSQR